MKKSATLLYVLLIAGFCQAQCFDPDSTIWINTWNSCEKTMNPKSEYGNSHWIQFDFGFVRTLSKSWAWNANDPTKLDQGFDLVSIDYSEDGKTWEHWGEMNFPKAEGEAIYGGFQGPDLLGVQAQYVLMTALSNHGDNSCSGLAEVKFNLLPGENSGGGCVVQSVPLMKLYDEGETSVSIYWEDAPGCDNDCSYTVQYRVAGSTTWEERDATSIFLLDGLQRGTKYEVRIGVTKDCDPDKTVFNKTDSFVTLGTTNVYETQLLNALRLYPNPTDSEFIVELPEKYSFDYKLINGYGSQVLEGQISNRVSTINISGLNKGIYYMRIQDVAFKVCKY